MRNSRCSTTSSALRPLVAVLLAVLLAGCTDLFFYPMRQQVLTPPQLGLASEDITLTADDGTKLFAWHLAAESPRGVVCYFHGNAENISTHVVNVSWLPAAGYEVLLVDYRGYGASGGRAGFPEVFGDVRAGLDWCLARGRTAGIPVFAFGQSLGAALTLDVVAQEPYRSALAGVVADSSFASYRGIARDALAHSWLLWPVKYPLSWLVTASHDPEDAAARLAPLPLLVMHSADDTVVPRAHGARVFAAAGGPKCFLPTRGPHNAALGPRSPDGVLYRGAVADFLAMTSGRDGGLACRPPLLDHFPDQ